MFSQYYHICCVQLLLQTKLCFVNAIYFAQFCGVPHSIRLAHLGLFYIPQLIEIRVSTVNVKGSHWPSIFIVCFHRINLENWLLFSVSVFPRGALVLRIPPLVHQPKRVALPPWQKMEAVCRRELMVPAWDQNSEIWLQMCTLEFNLNEH